MTSHYLSQTGTTMPIAIIAAMDRNRVIGYQGKLPWHLPEELQYFKQKTLHQTIIMGRKTFQSLGCRALPQRRNIIITRHPKKFVANHCEMVSSFDAALKLAAKSHGEIIVIGGQTLYELALPHTYRLYLTIIEHDFIGDRYFPTFDPTVWKCIEQRYHTRCADNQYPFYTLTLTREHTSV